MANTYDTYKDSGLGRFRVDGRLFVSRIYIANVQNYLKMEQKDYYPYQNTTG